MAEAETPEPQDPRLERLLHDHDLAWPVDDQELDAWLAEHALEADEQAWLKDVIRRRMAEAAGQSPSPGQVVGAPVGAEPVEGPAKKPEPVLATRAIPRLSYEDLALLNGELLELVAARVPLPEGLTTYAAELRGGRLERVMEDLRTDLEAGLPLSEAMSRRGDALPPIYRALVAAGEASGDLASCLSIMHDQAQVDADLDRRVRESLVYPALSLMVAVGGILLVLSVLGARYENLYASMGVELPLVTEAFVATSVAVSNNLLLSFGLLAGLGYGLKRSIPLLFRRVITGYRRNRGLAELARSLAGFLERGLPLTSAFRALSQADTHFPSSSLRDVLQRLEGGMDLAAALRPDPLFPATYVWMIGAAERRGDLPHALKVLAERHEQSFKGRVRRLETLVAPAAMLVIGIIVGLTIMSVFLPMFEMQKSLSQ